MSQMAHHWEALRRQRVVDRKYQALKRISEREAAEEMSRAEAAAEEERMRQSKSSSTKKEIKEQMRNKDKSAIKKHLLIETAHHLKPLTTIVKATAPVSSKPDALSLFIEIQRLMMERSWHNSLITQMEEEEKAQLMHELERDHFHKAKLLRDHGLYRGHKKFFTEPVHN